MASAFLKTKKEALSSKNYKRDGPKRGVPKRANSTRIYKDKEE